MSSALQEAVIWSIFGVCSFEIIGVLYLSQRAILSITKSQFVHKDHQIVTFVTFVVISLIFKLAVLIALH